MSKFFKCILLCLSLAGLCACQSASPSHEYMQAIDAYYDALEENQFTTLQQCMPAQVLDSLGLDAGELSNLVNHYSTHYGTDFAVTVTENGSARLDRAQLDDLSAYLAQQYGIDSDLQNAYLVEYTAEFDGSASANTLTQGVVVYQMRNDWYIDLQAGSTVDSIRRLYNQ